MKKLLLLTPLLFVAAAAHADYSVVAGDSGTVFITETSDNMTTICTVNKETEISALNKQIDDMTKQIADWQIVIDHWSKCIVEADAQKDILQTKIDAINAAQ